MSTLSTFLLHVKPGVKACARITSMSPLKTVQLVRRADGGCEPAALTMFFFSHFAMMKMQCCKNLTTLPTSLLESKMVGSGSPLFHCSWNAVTSLKLTLIYTSWVIERQLGVISHHASVLYLANQNHSQEHHFQTYQDTAACTTVVTSHWESTYILLIFCLLSFF